MSNRVVHFKIQAEDCERAMRFYKEVSDWKSQKWGQQDYWMIMKGAPNMEDKVSKERVINGGLLPRKGGTPTNRQSVNAYVCTVAVDNIDEIIKKVEKSTGAVALPDFAFRGMAWQAYYKDTEGNIFGVHQLNKNAK